MAITNRERVGKALDLLNEGLLPFVERELQAVYADRWQEVAREGQPAERGRGRPGGKAGGTPAPRSAGGTPAPRLAGGTPAPQKPHLDCHALLTVMWNQWNPVFSKTLGQAERSLVNELRDVRNNWAHQKNFSGNDAYRALDSMERMLTAVSAGQAGEIGQMRMDLLRLQFDEQRRSEMRKTSFAATEGKPQGGLKPWREVVTPHSDVVKGTYQQAEFAADLWQVYQNEGSDEYKNPTEFFRH